MSVLSPTKTVASAALMARAERVIPGGVNSPVRAYGAVGGTPRFIQSAKGAYLTDVDGNQYIDYVGSWGPMILGHNAAPVLSAVQAALENGMSFGAPCELEVQLAEAICQRFDSIDKVRMVNSGTEATMTAIRLARGVTGRDKIVKFEGCYHGHVDSLLVKAGSGALTFGTPSSPGVPGVLVKETLTATYNDLDSVTRLFDSEGQSIAAIIVEPFPGNMNFLLPEPGFLEGLRALCDQYGCLLIFDEVITGCRVSPQGVQGLISVKPDLTTLGKIIGGGMPVGAFGGSADIMGHLAPEGPVYQAGTLSGNPLAMAAGLATLSALTPAVYERLADLTATLCQGIRDSAQSNKVDLFIQYETGLFGLFFTNRDNITCYSDVMACDVDRFTQFFHAMLSAGVYLGPSAFESAFVSFAHTDADIEKTVAVIDRIFASWE